MADKRFWTQLDLGFTTNPKVQEVLAESAGAVVLYIHSVLTSCQHITDGFAKEKVVVRTAFASQGDADLLVTSGMWHRTGHDCPTCPQGIPVGEVYIHDFEEHNHMWTTRAAETRSEKATKAARARWAADSKSENATEHARENQLSMLGALAEQSPDGAPEMPYKTRQDETKSSSSSSTTGFDTFWSRYPRKVGRVAARKAYDKALKQVGPEELLEGVDRLKAEVAGKDPQFTPHPSSWLNAGRWADETGSSSPRVPSLWDEGTYSA